VDEGGSNHAQVSSDRNLRPRG
jgi:hypothetical protein